MVVVMDNILQDFHHWGIACYERFPERKYDVFTHRYITSGYRIFHGGDGTMIYVSEYARSDLRNLLTPESYNNMDYYKIIYKLKKACYFDGLGEYIIQLTTIQRTLWEVCPGRYGFQLYEKSSGWLREQTCRAGGSAERTYFSIYWENNMSDFPRGRGQSV